MQAILKSTVLIFILGVAMALIPLRVLAEHDAPHWGYTGESGPEHWDGTCQTGKLQSPIDLKWTKTQTGGKVEFSYSASPLKIIDNGHTIQVNFTPGSHVTLRGKSYGLVQMHFHTESEHQLSGKSFPMELHFVHKDNAGKLAVVGVFFKEGASNPWIEKIWANVPSEKGQEKVVDAETINPENLLPPTHTYYHYVGSLTTPPCSEGVNWNVMNTPIEMSHDQIEKFRTIYSSNARPVQPLHGRKPANF